MSLAAPPLSARILIVDDEWKMRDALARGLRKVEGWQVDTAACASEAFARLAQHAFDLLVLDWMLPDQDGLVLVRHARERQLRTSVLMITARGEEEERVRGLATGADDYVVKPFSMPELVARIQALLRRANPQLVTNTLKAGDLELDRQSHRVRRAGRDLHLGPTEYRLLEYLMRHPGRVYTREQLLDGVWGNDVYVDERTVDVHVGRLRKAINRGREPDPIRTVRGAGYAFDERFAALS